jgi:tetratricopeptide (TPR) repeat protein
MKMLLAVFLFLTLLGDGLKEASRINRAVQEAEALYRRGQYQQAADLYQLLSDSLQVHDDPLILNQAHAAFQAGNKALATRNYLLLTKNPDRTIQSIAFTQLGLIYFGKENPERALYTFRKALIQNPMNETARYNYELVKKYLAANPSLTQKAKQKKGPTPQQNQKPGNTAENAATRPDEEGQEGSTRDDQVAGIQAPIDRPEATGADNRGRSGAGARQPQPGAPGNPQQTPQGRQGDLEEGLSGETGRGNGPGSLDKEAAEVLQEREKQMQTLRARLKDADLSPEKATQLLEAMRNAELQYLQQVPHKAQKPRSPSKPDW